MQIQGSQRGTYEQIVGQYYIWANEWSNDYTIGTRGMNLRGLVCSLQLNLGTPNEAALEPYIGMAINLGVVAGIGSTSSCAIGVLLSDLVLDNPQLTRKWVTVLQYGHCPRILSTGGAVAATDHFLYTPNISGLVSGISSSEISARRGLEGVLTVSLSGNAEVFTINMNGTDTGTLGVPPFTVWGIPEGVPLVSETEMTPQFSMIGYHYLNDPEYVPEEIREGRVTGGPNADDYRYVRGFVTCLGTSVGRL